MDSVGYTDEELPPKAKPPGKPTRYQPVIDAAKATPGQWKRLTGEHHSSNIITLKAHGLDVRSRKSPTLHKHYLWVCYQPVDEPKTEEKAS
jgi:hypothetical protein